MNQLRIYLLPILLLASLSASARFDTAYWYGFSVETPPAAPDHSVWQDFLDRYQSDHGRIDYASVSKADHQALQQYLVELQQLDPRYYQYDRQLAFWLNLHNAAVVSLVLEKGATHLEDLGSNNSHRKEALFEVAGVNLSLDDIVEGILLPIWQMPEIHFLVACAPMHCPSVPREALHAANVQAAVQTAALEYSQRPGIIEFDENGTLMLAATFDTFANSLDDRSQLLRRVAFMADDRLALRLLGYQGEVEFRENTRIVAP